MPHWLISTEVRTPGNIDRHRPTLGIMFGHAENMRSSLVACIACQLHFIVYAIVAFDHIIYTHVCSYSYIKNNETIYYSISTKTYLSTAVCLSLSALRYVEIVLWLCSLLFGPRSYAARINSVLCECVFLARNESTRYANRFDSDSATATRLIFRLGALENSSRISRLMAYHKT